MQHSQSDAPGFPGSNLHVCVWRKDGSTVPARLRLLKYEGCEISCDLELEPGEQVNIEIFRMGSIRARVVSINSGIIEVEFMKECPV
jgi:hypothetical protein